MFFVKVIALHISVLVVFFDEILFNEAWCLFERIIRLNENDFTEDKRFLQTQDIQIYDKTTLTHIT